MALHSMGAGSSELLKGSASGITDDGYGHMEPEGFVMRIAPGHVPPAPWSNIIMARDMGMLVTERGGGFIWFANSRLNRITSFDNDPADEGWSLMLYVCDRKGAYIPGLPGPAPAAEYGARHSLHASAWRCEAAGIIVETQIYGDEAADELRFEVNIANRSGRDGEYRVVCFVDWLMGADSSDAVRLRAWNHEGSLFAAGASDRVAYLTCSARRRECGPCRSIFLGSGGVMRPDGLMSRGDGGSVLAGITDIQDGGHGKIVFSMGSRPDAASAVDAARRRAGVMPPENTAREYWDELRDRFCISTGDRTLDMHLNGFFLKQVIDGRIRARAGFYQAGGAFGFRDQLQDMLALLPYEPETVRSHILLCAGRQFEDGDVMHWWHPPMTGVRTHISDDLLFLPYVTARYVNFTGDTALLDESVHYLKNAEIPAGWEDVYGRMEISGNAGALREHCMRALRRAHRTGEHGLLKMGAGDWNDGMNRVGALGRGESVWLSMFFAVCAREFAALLPDGMDRAWLISAAEGQTAAVEKNGWDGGWYLRAYDDAGMPLGSRECAECRIDLISQAWSVFAGCDSARTDAALEAAWRELYMPEEGILRLLAPPFTGETRDPGYIAAYPPGVRENGGQYTHAACWYLMALARRGDAARAGELLRALMPYEHAKDAGRYRVEPYVLAADIYTEGSCCGMGGWTWYTGSAGWLLCAVRALLGFEKNGDKVRMNALEGIWARPQIRLKYGSTVYTLISDPGADSVTENGANITGGYINLRDDGGEHVCIFPQRKGMGN